MGGTKHSGARFPVNEIEVEAFASHPLSPPGVSSPAMARKLPDNTRHIRSINYRSAMLGRQLESLRLALIELAIRGGQDDAVRGFAAIRDQIDLLEADMREIVRDQPPVT